jgi:hypothetical protein
LDGGLNVLQNYGLLESFGKNNKKNVKTQKKNWRWQRQKKGKKEKKFLALIEFRLATSPRRSDQKSNGYRL